VWHKKHCEETALLPDRINRRSVAKAWHTAKYIVYRIVVTHHTRNAYTERWGNHLQSHSCGSKLTLVVSFTHQEKGPENRVKSKKIINVLVRPEVSSIYWLHSRSSRAYWKGEEIKSIIFANATSFSIVPIRNGRYKLSNLCAVLYSVFRFETTILNEPEMASIVSLIGPCVIIRVSNSLQN
jgi:hypothetical protein